jgi:predicted 3-demethylubiquinone-9 3-methyltransferase (glyoxalase superfamily)
MSIPFSKITPCIWLNDQAQQAASFYVHTFPAGRIVGTSRYPESVDNPGGRPRGSVLTVEFEMAGQRFTTLNAGPVFAANPSLSFFVHVDATTDADPLYAALADGGKVLMPLDTYPWSERYGWVTDRFGVSWQVISGRRPKGGATLAPCLMFAGSQHGRAEQALRHYAAIFPDGRVDSVERYEAGQGPPGTVKHGRFAVFGREMVAMDSHVAHGFSFNEALSLQLRCEDQDELDRYWAALGEGGEHGPCGWLKDRFGLSWQIVPTAITEWMASPDPAARDRVLQAVWQMKKLDISVLERAHDGR